MVIHLAGKPDGPCNKAVKITGRRMTPAILLPFFILYMPDYR